MKPSVAIRKTLKKEEILVRLKQHKDELQQKFPIVSLALFGSYARGDENPESDIDIMIELSEPMGWDFVDIVEYLETVFEGNKIDLISKGGIKPKMWPYIEEDVIYV